MTQLQADLLSIIASFVAVPAIIWLFSFVLDSVNSFFAEIPAPDREPVEHFEGEP